MPGSNRPAYTLPSGSRIGSMDIHDASALSAHLNLLSNVTRPSLVSDAKGTGATFILSLSPGDVVCVDGKSSYTVVEQAMTRRHAWYPGTNVIECKVRSRSYTWGLSCHDDAGTRQISITRCDGKKHRLGAKIEIKASKVG